MSMSTAHLSRILERPPAPAQMYGNPRNTIPARPYVQISPAPVWRSPENLLVRAIIAAVCVIVPLAMVYS